VTAQVTVSRWKKCFKTLRLQAPRYLGLLYCRICMGR